MHFPLCEYTLQSVRALSIIRPCVIAAQGFCRYPQGKATFGKFLPPAEVPVFLLPLFLSLLEFIFLPGQLSFLNTLKNILLSCFRCFQREGHLWCLICHIAWDERSENYYRKRRTITKGNTTYYFLIRISKIALTEMNFQVLILHTTTTITFIHAHTPTHTRAHTHAQLLGTMYMCIWFKYRIK